jgi:hypothetical protein
MYKSPETKLLSIDTGFDRSRKRKIWNKKSG